MYLKITDAQKKKIDEGADISAIDIGMFLKELSFNQVTPTLTAGATGVTVAANVFVVPTKARITKVTGIIDVVQTGTGNTPTIELYNLTKTEVIAVSAAVALAGTIGNKIACPITAANSDVSEGDVLQFRIVNPAGTITVPLQAKAVIEWNSEA